MSSTDYSGFTDRELKKIRKSSVRRYRSDIKHVPPMLAERSLNIASAVAAELDRRHPRVDPLPLIKSQLWDNTTKEGKEF